MIILGNTVHFAHENPSSMYMCIYVLYRSSPPASSAAESREDELVIASDFCAWEFINLVSRYVTYLLSRKAKTLHLKAKGKPAIICFVDLAVHPYPDAQHRLMKTRSVLENHAE